MAFCTNSAPPDIKHFQCSIVGDNVQCSNNATQKDITIPMKDIVCILPERGNQGDGYTMLFLRQVDSTIECDKLTDSTHLDTVLLSPGMPPQLQQYICTDEAPYLMDPDTNIEVHIIISTASGTGLAKAVFGNILQQLLSYIGLTRYELHETYSACTVTELCHSTFIPRSEKRLAQTLILLSGDGGLSDLLDAFYKKAKANILPPTVALIPVGTGNAMASSMGLLDHPKFSLIALLRGKPVVMPTFAARFSGGASYIIEEGRTRLPITGSLSSAENQDPTIYGGVVASWGIHAALVADSDTVSYRRFGSDRFKMAAKELLFPSDGGQTHKYRGTITLTKSNSLDQGERRELLDTKEHMYVLATLVPNLEKDFMISPQSSPLDGSLRLVHFSPLKPEHAMQVMSSAYQKGQHVDDQNVLYAEIEGLKIEFHEIDEKWRRVCVDGKVVVVDEGGWMEVFKEQRRLIRLLSLK